MKHFSVKKGGFESFVRIVALFVPFLLFPFSSSAAEPPSRIAAGKDFKLIVDQTGQLWSLGEGQYQGSFTPLPVAQAKNVTSVSAAHGNHTSYFITQDRTLWGYGTSQYGQLGLYTTGMVTRPIPLLKHIVAVDAGHNTPFAIDEQGRLWSWGDESLVKGQPPVPDEASPSPPFPAGLVMIMRAVIQVRSTLSHTLALKEDGSLWAWGDNQSGALGDGTLTDRRHPVKVNLSALGNRKIVAIAARPGESFAVADDGTLWQWGWNFFACAGQDTSPVTTPQRVPSVDQVKTLALGLDYLLIRKKDDSIWILGNTSIARQETCTGSTEDPKPVLWLPARKGRRITQITSGYHEILLLTRDETLISREDTQDKESGFPKTGRSPSRTTPFSQEEKRP